MTFPIDQVRARFPALKRTHNNKSVVYFDGPGGTQALDSAIEAICNYMTHGGSNRHGISPATQTGKETEKLIAKAREDMKALLNAHDCEVAFGPNATTLMFHVSRALAKQWNAGDEIILAEIDHHANIDTWRTAAEDKNVVVKYIPLCTKTLKLDLEKLDSLITPKTKLIAVGAASNCIGTITDVAYVSQKAKECGAILTVDAVHAVPHYYMDMQKLGIDMLYASAYKFFGAHLGMAVIQKDLFASLDIYRIAAASDSAPDCLEIGTQNHEGIPSVSAIVEFIASLGVGNTFKEQIISGYEAMEKYENSIADYIRTELRKINGITLYEADEHTPKTPTIAFRAEGISPYDFCVRMCEEHGVFLACGNFSAKTLAEKLGVYDKGSFIRAGMAPYNTMEEADKFLAGVKAITKGT